MIFGGFEDEKWQPMEGRCLGIEILAREWLESGQKTPQKGRVATVLGLAEQREEEERDGALIFFSFGVNTWCILKDKYLAEI